MLRLREIETKTAEHEERLEAAWRELADACGDDGARFEREWRALASRWSFDEVNDLIDRHNRWYPIESQLSGLERQRIESLLNHLDDRSAGIMRARYGLEDGREHSLTEVASRGVVDGQPDQLVVVELLGVLGTLVGRDVRGQEHATGVLRGVAVGDLLEAEQQHRLVPSGAGDGQRGQTQSAAEARDEQTGQHSGGVAVARRHTRQQQSGEQW
jgi:hypothetical protein